MSGTRLSRPGQYATNSSTEEYRLYQYFMDRLDQIEEKLDRLLEGQVPKPDNSKLDALLREAAEKTIQDWQR